MCSLRPLMWLFSSTEVWGYLCTSNVSHTSICTCHKIRKCFWLGQNRFLYLGENKWTSPAYKIRLVWTSIHLKNISRGKRMQIISEVIWKITSLKGNKKTFPSSSLLHRPPNKQTNTHTSRTQQNNRKTKPTCRPNWEHWKLQKSPQAEIGALQ